MKLLFLAAVLGWLAGMICGLVSGYLIGGLREQLLIVRDREQRAQEPAHRAANHNGGCAGKCACGDKEGRAA